jgi:hypothetical protein
MIAMTMMKLPLKEVIDMITMRNGRMAAISMPTGTINLITLSGILTTYFDDMLIVMSVMTRMKMSIMKIIDMPTMLDSNMTAVFSMYMRVVRVYCMVQHFYSFLFAMLLTNETERH